MSKPLELIFEKTLKASGADAQRHFEKYVKPHVGKRGGMTVTKKIDDKYQTGDEVTIHSHRNIKGVRHVVVSKPHHPKIEIPISKLLPTNYKAPENKGAKAEEALAKVLQKEGLMDKSSKNAGFSADEDFHLLDKREQPQGVGPEKDRILGKEGGQQLAPSRRLGEAKKDRTAAFGQVTITRDPDTGKWSADHVEGKNGSARDRRPEFVSHAEKASVKIGGKKYNIIKHLDEIEKLKNVQGKGNFKADITNSLAPVHAYMRDHSRAIEKERGLKTGEGAIHVLHVESHGTFRAGDSEKTDHMGLQLPVFQGAGHFVVRRKTANPNKRTIMFLMHSPSTPKSKAHIMNNAHQRQELKYMLGHETHPADRVLGNDVPGGHPSEFHSPEEMEHIHGEPIVKDKDGKNVRKKRG